MDVHIGADVFCVDGKAGSVERVVFSPRRRMVSHLIVGKGMVLHKDIVVPIDRVVRADDRHVDLDLTLDELKDLPEYKVVEYIAPDPTWNGPKQYEPEFTLLTADPYAVAWTPRVPSFVGKVLREERLGVPQDAAVVRRGTPVEAQDGKVGEVDHVLIDPASYIASHIVVRQGRLLHHDVAIPIDWVTRIDDDGIELGVGKAELEKLPEYRPGKTDAILAADLHEALRSDERTRDSEITVRSDRGMVELNGRVRNDDARVAASEIARDTPGVWLTHNRLAIGSNGTSRSVDTAGGVDVEWVVQLLHRAFDLHIGSGQAREIVTHAERKLRDFFEIAEDSALANSREVLFERDLPLTKGLRRTLKEYQAYARDLSAAALEAYLSDMGLLARLDPALRAELPRLYASLLLLGGRIVVAIEPGSARAGAHAPSDDELRRAMQVIDLTL